MFKNYLKTTYRSLKKNLNYTLINIIGLGIGLSGVIITYALVDYEIKFDNQYKNTNLTYRINSLRSIENETQKWGITPLPLGPELSSQISGIESFTRYGTSRVIVKYDDNTHSENLFFADYNFFDQFNFPLISGERTTFHDKNTVLISQDFSKKYFGEENSIGKQIEIVLNNQIVQSFVIGGIVDKIPENSSFKFDVIAPYDNIYEIYQLDEDSWTVQIPTITYIKLEKDIDPAFVEENLLRYAEKNNELLEAWER
jgi:putative ABC transport system permease protein